MLGVGIGKAFAQIEERRSSPSNFQPVDKHAGYSGVGTFCFRFPIHSLGWKVPTLDLTCLYSEILSCYVCRGITWDEEITEASF